MLRLRSRNVALSAAFIALAATTMAGCASDDERKYCGDEERNILSADRCDGDDSSTFIYIGSYGHTYAVGDRLPSEGTTKKISSTDQAARQKVGIPPRGGFGGTGSKMTGGAGG